MNYIVPLTSPPSKGLAIGRKITSKVFLLVDRFESLTKNNKPVHTNDDFGCDGSGSTADSNSPTSDTNSTPIDTDTSSTSTPAEQVLPSSFFRQLVQSGENTSNKNKKNTRKTTKRKKSPPMPSVRDLRNNMHPKSAAQDSRPESPAKDMLKNVRLREFGFSGFKRKSTPHNPSVKELRERFQKAERTQPVKEVPLRVLSREELKSRQEQKPTNGRSQAQLGREAGSTSRIPSSDNGTARTNNEERQPADYEEMERFGYLKFLLLADLQC